MECKEFEKKIPSFLSKDMDYETMEAFHEHMSECSNCKEELTIQFLVTDGIKHLEAGEAFDIDKEFNSIIDASRRKHKRTGIVLNASQWILTFVLFLIGALFIVLFG